MSIDVLDTASLKLITTKLHRPAVGAGLIRRARLSDLLDRAHIVPLTLISAPAGSGKTTLLSDWLSTYPYPSAWVSLDEDDSVLPAFLDYFIGAIRTIFPGACEKTLRIVHASEQPPAHVLTGQLINELENLPENAALGTERHFVLVLDDYHLVAGQAVNELLIALLRHPPQTLHLVLATRSDPALPLANLRARGQLLEIRRHDLRFTPQETAAFLDHTVGLPVDQEVAALLASKMEGWITGLYLVALNLRQAPDPKAFLLDLSSSDRYVMDYLLDEVLARQSPIIQDYLLKTSILDGLNEDLCAAVTGLGAPAHAEQTYLEQIEHANLFVVALDNRRQWYRYHHLFQQFLRFRLARWASPAQIADLHLRASAWYGSHGFVEDAITHALAAGDEKAVVEVIEAHRHAAMNQERWSQLEQWLRLLPRQLLDKHPELLLLQAWILQKQWRMAEIGPYLDRIETLMASQLPPDQGRAAQRAEVDALRSLVCYYRLDGENTFAFARRALQTLPMSYSSVRGLAYMYCGGGLQALGDIEGAQRVLQDGLEEDIEHGNAFPSRILIALCMVHLTRGDMRGVNQTAAYLLKLATARNLAESIYWAHYFQGCAAYLVNDLAAAGEHFAAVVPQRYLAHSLPYSQSAFGLAAVYVAQGDTERARALADTVVAYGLEMNNMRVLTDAQAFQAWLALRQGRSVEARHWTEATDGKLPLLPMTTFHAAIMTLAKILTLSGDPTSLRKASEVLRRVSQYTESQRVTRFMIEVRALQAIVNDAWGQTVAARLALDEALALAEPGGLVRIFVDLGPKMARLLARLGNDSEYSRFIERILHAFPAVEVPDRLPAQRTASFSNQPALIEPLTNRELEVLALLAQRLSAKEIAQRLVISDRTAKRHTANIYQKLGVNSRREAVETASALGVLSQTF